MQPILSRVIDEKAAESLLSVDAECEQMHTVAFQLYIVASVQYSSSDANIIQVATTICENMATVVCCCAGSDLRAADKSQNSSTERAAWRFCCKQVHITPRDNMSPACHDRTVL